MFLAAGIIFYYVQARCLADFPQFLSIVIILFVKFYIYVCVCVHVFIYKYKKPN